MNDAVKKEHFNLFYIFEEDKKYHTLSEEKLNKLRQALFSALEARPPTKN